MSITLRKIILNLFYLSIALIPLSIEVGIGSTGVNITYPIELLIPIVCVLLPIYYFLSKPRIDFRLLDKLLVFFLVAVTLSTIFSLYPKISIKYLITIIAYFSIGYVVPKVLELSKKEWITTLYFFSFGVVTLCIWTLCQFYIEGISYESSYIVSRPFIKQGHTNLSFVVEPLMLASVGMFTLSKTKTQKSLSLFIFLLTFAVVDYSWSRASFITSTFSLIGLILLMNLKLRQNRKTLLFIVLSIYLIAIIMAFVSAIVWNYMDANWSHYAFLMLIIIGISLIRALKIKSQKQLVLFILIGISIPIGTRKSYELFHEYFYRDYSYYDPNDPMTRKGNSIINVMDIVKPEENTSNIERIIRWKNGIKMFKNHPITGIGPGCFPDHQLNYLAKDLVENTSNISHFKMNIHNLYLGWLSEGGLLWFLSGLVLFGYVIVKMIQRIALVKGNNWPLKIKRSGVIKRILFIYLCSFIFHGIFQDFNNEPRVIILFWLALGLFTFVVKKGSINPARQQS